MGHRNDRRVLYRYEPESEPRVYEIASLRSVYAIVAHDPDDDTYFPVTVSFHRDGVREMRQYPTSSTELMRLRSLCQWLNMITGTSNFEIHELFPNSFTHVETPH